MIDSAVRTLKAHSVTRITLTCIDETQLEKHNLFNILTQILTYKTINISNISFYISTQVVYCSIVQFVYSIDNPYWDDEIDFKTYLDKHTFMGLPHERPRMQF